MDGLGREAQRWRLPSCRGRLLGAVKQSLGVAVSRRGETPTNRGPLAPARASYTREDQMAHWTSVQTAAGANVKSTLSVVDDLLAYMGTGKGKPSKQERAIFASAVVFTYGVWESYVEDLAIELASNLSATISPEKVPQQVREMLESSSAWELGVHPGWRRLWVHKVSVLAKGEGESYGLNTANAKQVGRLFKAVGVGTVIDEISTVVVPAHMSSKSKTAEAAVDELVRLRGEIVHTGAVPTTLKKHHSREWRQFVEDLVADVDRTCRSSCALLLK